MIRSILLISGVLLSTSVTPALAGPPSSCASKFIGEWRHSGSGNRASVMADGRALCSENPACTQGTWTCSGNVFIYTNVMGTWNYTLTPDGRAMSTGSAVATRLGPVPSSARSRDLGAASNVTADILGIDRTPSAVRQEATTAPPAKPATVAGPSSRRSADPEAEANAKEARKFFKAGVEAAKRRDWSAAEDDFSVARERFRSAHMHNDAETAASNARLAGEKRLHPTANAKPRAAVRGKPSKEECEQVGTINIAIVDRATTPELRGMLIKNRDRLKARCK